VKKSAGVEKAKGEFGEVLRKGNKRVFSGPRILKPKIQGLG